MKKIIKIVLLSILFIIIFGLIITLVFPFTRGGNKELSSFDNVLSSTIGSSEDKYDTKITEIALLGAHDAFSNGITFNSDPNVNEGGIVNNRIVRFFTKGFIVKMSKAQAASAKEMLYAGVRYFDVRITKIDNEFYACHGLLSSKLDDYVSDIVEFLSTHNKEYIIFDIQHYYTENGSNQELKDEDYEALFNKLTELGLMDYIYYSKETKELKDLTYRDLTNNATSSGVLMLAKTNINPKVYYRDNDANKNTNIKYETIRSYWHNTNSIDALLSGIDTEYEFIKENGYDSNILRVNQAQLTGFIMDKNIYRSILGYSLINMASNSNKKIIEDEAKFKEHLKVMPIVMVDYVTSTKGDFNNLVNTYIMEYNNTL
ncbi:MAG: hypothetical protein J6W64_05260 [Bacilli bacterium]|nr:hypothetical protein [Bacilli bacterium]